MSEDPRATRRKLLGLALDGAGTGPGSSDGETRMTRGEDYLLVGGTEHLHEAMQQMAEYMSDCCRDEGTTLGEAPRELLADIIADLTDDPPFERS